MPRTHSLDLVVQFGECDPAGIVFYPNFLRWMDASSLNFFRQCGLPPWRELTASRGIVGTPLLELINVRFIKSATYGETVRVVTSVEEWRAKVFVHQHRVERDGDLLCEAREVRAFIYRDASEGGRLRAMPVPEDIRAMCS
ncbi:MAG TPA: acyl-CoA thioesterase [Burkholderiaceae bacterium]|jgi:4-hydroxybenzoyl-CoA thioesterase|nr:acyl-CoA thioesterase [Burkholderiaceae bacterium]